MPEVLPECDELRYVSDVQPGIRRRRTASGFCYYDASRRRITDPATLKRIKALAIPPAYRDVWICPDPNGHLQATGRDARGRKQYRYHPAWAQQRGQNKYESLLEFGQALPRIRRAVRQNLTRRRLDADKVVAVVVRLLEVTHIRIGTRQYALENQSYGLTTLKRRHAKVSGNELRLCFRGKSGVRHDVTVRDARLARIVKRCMELPGQQLFNYRGSDGRLHAVTSHSVNNYLKKVTGGDFSAKDYRTWAGSVYAFSSLQKDYADANNRQKAVVEVVKQVAKRLNNTPAVCRACYIHPSVIEAYLDGTLPAPVETRAPSELRSAERRFLAFLKAQRRRKRKSTTAPLPQ